MRFSVTGSVLYCTLRSQMPDFQFRSLKPSYLRSKKYASTLVILSTSIQLAVSPAKVSVDNYLICILTWKVLYTLITVLVKLIKSFSASNILFIIMTEKNRMTLKWRCKKSKSSLEAFTSEVDGILFNEIYIKKKKSGLRPCGFGREKAEARFWGHTRNSVLPSGPIFFIAYFCFYIILLISIIKSFFSPF